MLTTGTLDDVDDASGADTADALAAGAAVAAALAVTLLNAPQCVQGSEVDGPATRTPVVFVFAQALQFQLGWLALVAATGTAVEGAATALMRDGMRKERRERLRLSEQVRCRRG
jgi:hypothetical protein